MADATVRDLDDRIVFANRAGTFAVWKRIVYDARGRSVGPGYVGRVVLRNGHRLVEGFVDPTLALNDTRQQGLALFGWHHHRDVPGETDVWNRSWNMDVHRDAAGDGRGGFGVSACRVAAAPVERLGVAYASLEVDLVDPWSAREGKRIASVRYDYAVSADDLSVWVTVTQQPDGADAGPRAFAKEPKVTSAMCPTVPDGAALRFFDLFRDDGVELVRHLDMDGIGDPTVHTRQLGFDRRCRARFSEKAGGYYWNVVGRASRPLVYAADGHPATYGPRADWEGAGFGLDQWAVAADARAPFDDSVCPRYCLQGPPAGALTRQWELVKAPAAPGVELHFHAWEGGYGTPDCLCAARELAPRESWTAYLSFSLGSGWRL